MSIKVRRVVTGTDAQGKAAFVSDGPAPLVQSNAQGVHVVDLWRSYQVPDNLGADGGAASGYQPLPPSEGLVVRIAELPPDGPIPPGVKPEEWGMHDSETIDFVVILSGEICHRLVSGAEVTLKAGDTLVQRATRHAWRNRSGKPCVMAVVKVAGRRG